MAISTSTQMDFTVWAIMDQPPPQVFEAVADPQRLSAHFTTGGAKGRMETGATVTWEFADFPGPFDVQVIRVAAPDLIEFDWPRNDGTGANRVTFRFAPEGQGRTRVTVTESGWDAMPEGLALAYGNCMGWSMMLAAMKAWLDHGIVLRQGMFR
ncbi:MAG: SRPBCC domain-containing protein [Paracoccus sp. (in: a-proteobacteria)]|nr:SRPBCC domain-containing protein [Paracoccus sp. (in: a-proteobacteria)]